MTRRIKDQRLDTRSARRELKPRGKPYWRLIEPGLHLGYRRLKDRPGTWTARHYLQNQKYELEAIGSADDFSDADGRNVLDFAQAQEAARTSRKKREGIAPNGGPYTVDNAIDDYLKWMQAEGRSAAAISDTETRADAFIRPKLGEKRLDRLTADDLRHWRDAIARAPARLRTKGGEKQQHRTAAKDTTEEERDNDRRARRSTVNRIWTTLRAALNRAFASSKVGSDAEWRKVKPFRGVEKARVRYLEIADAQRLANATNKEFRPMVQGALLTGGRYGQLGRLVVADFNRDAGTVRMATRKGDGTEKTYHVHLTDDGVAFFVRACAGKAGRDLIFRKDSGEAWAKSEQFRLMNEASTGAGIAPAVNFHCLRHTYASHAVMRGAPLLVVAKNFGHTDTRMVEKHYGHLSPSYVADAIRKSAPRFGFKADKKIASLDAAR